MLLGARCTWGQETRYPWCSLALLSHYRPALSKGQCKKRIHSSSFQQKDIYYIYSIDYELLGKLKKKIEPTLNFQEQFLKAHCSTYCIAKNTASNLTENCQWNWKSPLLLFIAKLSASAPLYTSKTSAFFTGNSVLNSCLIHVHLIGRVQSPPRTLTERKSGRGSCRWF